MNNFSIAIAAVAVWLGLGLVFLSMCRAASRADHESENALGLSAKPRTFKQHVFAVHARSLRSMRRITGTKGHVRSTAAREHDAHTGMRSAH